MATDDLVLATTWHEPARRRREAVRACMARDIGSLLSLLDTYLHYRGRRSVHTSSNTRAYYRLATRDWIHYCWPDKSSSPQVALLRATQDDVELYLAVLQRDGGHLPGSWGKALEPGSAASYLAGIRAFYRALLWAKALEASPAQDVIAPVDPRPRHERRAALPLRDYRALLEHCSGDDVFSLRASAALRLMGDQGLRISEVVGLHVDHVDMRNRQLHIRGKGGKTRTVPLSGSSYAALQAWLALRPQYAQADEKALLVNVGKMVKKTRLGRAMHSTTLRLQLEQLYRQVGIPARYRGAHILRHTAGTRLYRNTKDLHVVSQILGHSDVNTSAIYAKMDYDSLSQAMEGLDEE